MIGSTMTIGGFYRGVQISVVGSLLLGTMIDCYCGEMRWWQGDWFQVNGYWRWVEVEVVL
jgi:hypothetical protein